MLGIIEDAHKNRGLGIEFLKHIERTHILCFVLDMSGTEGDPLEDLQILRNELKLYKEVSCYYYYFFFLFFFFSSSSSSLLYLFLSSSSSSVMY
jgi:hypothetical protein